MGVVHITGRALAVLVDISLVANKVVLEILDELCRWAQVSLVVAPRKLDDFVIVYHSDVVGDLPEALFSRDELDSDGGGEPGELFVAVLVPVAEEPEEVCYALVVHVKEDVFEVNHALVGLIIYDVDDCL